MVVRISLTSLGQSLSAFVGKEVKLYTVQEAADLLTVTPYHTQRLARTGELQATKFGKSWYFAEEAIKEYLANHVRGNRHGVLPEFRSDSMRYCSVCHVEKPITEFYSYVTWRCKACVSQDSIARQRAHDLVIAERDKWICQICHKKVNPRIKFPHPKSATTDHIVPGSLGGSGKKENLQLAHWGCNQKKRTKAIGCQLLVFG
jgi:excisionase family DNA binding protein